MSTRAVLRPCWARVPASDEAAVAKAALEMTTKLPPLVFLSLQVEGLLTASSSSVTLRPASAARMVRAVAPFGVVNVAVKPPCGSAAVVTVKDTGFCGSGTARALTLPEGEPPTLAGRPAG